MKFSSNDRHILVITGKHDESLQYAKKITHDLNAVEIVEQKKATAFLGQELDAVIFDTHSEFDPNAFGAMVGTVRGGGFLILLRPSSPPQNSLFIKRFNQLLENNDRVLFLGTNDQQELLLPPPPVKTFTDSFATPDQKSAVAAILNVVTGHRRRPLVITSDRGRGKSAALGLAAAVLAKQGVKNIIICAPSKKTAAIVFKHADIDSRYEMENNLSFYSPDDLYRLKPSADLVLIDEAAAIPVSLLTAFLKQYSRIVFASTQHGYEGSGRGFAINFHKILDSETPQWNQQTLKSPIRWNDNDTVEQFSYEALLLNAEATDESLIKHPSLEDCEFKQIDKHELIENNHKLKALFGLLVSAHYQTKPSDLKQLLDDDNLVVYCLETNNTIVAVALVISEGNIDPTLSKDIFDGNRRLQGHLVAQALSSNIGIESAITLSGERISRIAVHPSLQNKGLGSYLIKALIKQSKADYLSTCYGATTSLLNFWRVAGFKSVHLGIKRDASSGVHSVTMLLAKNDQGLELCKQAELLFSRSFPELLSLPFKELDSEIVLSLLTNPTTPSFSSDDIKVLEAFANENRGYENSLYLIKALVLSRLADSSILQNLSENEINILVMKVLQQQNWDNTKQKMAGVITGKKDGLKLVRQAISKIL